MDPAGALVFGYVAGGHVVVDMCFHFGWRNSPGFGGLVASALEHSNTRSTFNTAVVSRQGEDTVAHVVVAPPRGGPVVPLPRDCQPVLGTEGNTGSSFVVRYYVDDGILMELQWWPVDRRCQRAVQLLGSVHFHLLDECGASDPPLLSNRKKPN